MFLNRVKGFIKFNKRNLLSCKNTSLKVLAYVHDVIFNILYKQKLLII